MCVESDARAVLRCAHGLAAGNPVGAALNIAQAEHAAQNPVAPLLARLGAGQRIVARGRLGNAGQHGVLGEREFAETLAVVDLGRRFKPVRAMAEEHPVHVQLEDLFFGQTPFNPDGEEDLIEFAHEGALKREKIVACHLHGERAAPRAFFTREHQFRHRPQQPADSDAAMFEKAIVFRGQ